MESRSKTDEDGRVSRAVAQAREAMETGRPALARDVLVEHVSTTYDRQALGLLGQVLYDLEDLSGAGAAWFGTTARGARVDEATAAWRASHHDDFGALWRSLPKPVRTGPRLPKVEALRVKAFPGGAARREPAGGIRSEPAAPLTTTATNAAPSAPALNPSGTSGTTEPDSTPSAAAAPTSAKMATATPASPAAKAATATAAAPLPPSALAEVTAPAVKAPPATVETPQPQTTDRPERRTRRDTDQGSARSASDASLAGPQSPGRAMVSRVSHRAPEPVRRIEMARIVSWVLATLFVFCAVVGAITIIGWLIPG